MKHIGPARFCPLPPPPLPLPPQFHSRGAMRCWYFAARHLTYEAVQPEFLRVRPLGAGRTLVEVHGLLTFHPKRTLLLPPSLLLPRTILC